MCTAITVIAKDNSAILARTLEWGAFFLDSDVMVVPRNQTFQSTTPDGKPGLQWTGKYGLVGVNVVHSTALSDGMNEKGLGISVLYLPGFEEAPKYDPAKASETIATHDLAMWMLSNCATTDELRQSLPSVRVADVVLPAFHGIAPPIHFIAMDPSGKAIVIQYIKGKLDIYDNPVGVMTNAPEFPWHLTNLRNYAGLHPQPNQAIKVGDLEITPLGAGSGMAGLPGDFLPTSRFVRAVAFRNTAQQQPNGIEAVNNAFRILDNFNIPLGTTAAQSDLPTDDTVGSTQWTSAMDTKSLRYYYHTMFNRTVRVVDLKSIDFGKGEIRYVPLDRVKEQNIETVEVG